MQTYQVKQLHCQGEQINVCVPASKSITNRALLLAALSNRTVRLTGGALSDDTRAFLNCLKTLGIEVREVDGAITVCGCGGKIPNKTATIDVQSAGTAARFLTVALAFCGGDYLMNSSEQMKKRPMQEIITLLRSHGAIIECSEQEGHFPFRLKSEGIAGGSFSVNTNLSSQFASALLMAASVAQNPVEITLQGSRTQGSYIAITLRMLQDFGIKFTKNQDTVTVFCGHNTPNEYAIEPDISGACYFYATSLLLRRKVLVFGTNENSIQGDMKFLSLLQKAGVTFTQTEKGYLADGTQVESFEGFDVDMQDYSDQALTVAVLAPFATSPTVIRNVAHIKLQECDRINAIVENLSSLGVSATTDGENVYISPAPIKGGRVKTYDDHRVAMAFALIGLKTGNVIIENPSCCSKTFENYFEILDNLQ